MTDIFFTPHQTSTTVPYYRQLAPYVPMLTNEQRIVKALERIAEIGETLLLRDSYRSTAPQQPKAKR